jgi:arabinosaccharide transport system substrate-binding protein
MQFPFGNAPLAILILAVISGAALLASSGQQPPRPDLIYETFTKEHAAAYRPVIAAFEKENNCTIRLEVVDQFAVRGRLQAALQVGAPVPDMVELLDDTLGLFTQGPLEDVGFVDLTDRVHQSGLYDKCVQSRFAKWTSRGHIFALPHDVHPVMLGYRRDLIDQLGIDVTKLTTWDDFCRVGRQVVARSRGPDGLPQHYMINLPADGADALRMFILQDGVPMFTPQGDVNFDQPATADVLCWYVHQSVGRDRIAFDAGYNQNFSRAMADGLFLFFICPDWRTMQVQMDSPYMAGKLALIPVPAWRPGGLRTTTWGATGLTITKQCKNVDLAWKLAMRLYYNPVELGPRFASTNILPPLKSAWTLPQFLAPRPFWSNQRLGQIYSALAPDVPAQPPSPYMLQASYKLMEAFANSLEYYQAHGDNGLHDYALAELHRCADDIRTIIRRNVFWAHASQNASDSGNQPAPAAVEGGHSST